MDACITYPMVKNKPSNLYKELYKYTGKDRKLTNFLYALSLQDSVKKMFSHSDFNSQGEISSKSYVQKMNVDLMLSNKTNLRNERERVGAIDSEGNPIAYKDINLLINKVIDYNNNSTGYRAKIQYNNNAFIMNIDVINAENININSALETRKNIYNNTINYIRLFGLSGSLSENSLIAFNAYSVYNFIDNLKKLSTLSNRSISPSIARLLLDLLLDLPLSQRVQGILGENAAIIISKASGYGKDENFVIEDVLKNIIDRFLNLAFSKLKSISPSQLQEIIDTELGKIDSKETFYGTDGMTLKNTLKELYNLYHIDKDIINQNNRTFEKVSDVVNELMRINIKELENYNSSNSKDTEREKILLKIQKQIDLGNYCSSIVSMLESIKLNIEGNENAIRAIPETLKNDTAEIISNYSQSILSQLKLHKSFSGILQNLKNIDSLENDDALAPPEIVEAIRETANSLYNSLEKSVNNARSKQFDLVYAFLKIYWGEDKVFKGESYNLEEMMRLARLDINIFDRFLYSMTDVSSPLLALVGEAIKENHEARDEKMRDILYDIRVATEELYKTSDSSFIFERDEKGISTGKLISPFDFKKYDKEKEEYKKLLKELKLDKYTYKYRLSTWERKHTKEIDVYKDVLKMPGTSIKIRVPIYKNDNWDSKLTTALKNYYITMMKLKTELSSQVPHLANDIFNAVQLSSDLINSVQEAGGNPTKIYNLIKNQIKDVFLRREDDTDFGTSQYIGDKIKRVETDANGQEVLKLPLFFTHNLKDKSRLSTDFSRSMTAFAASVTLYSEMNKILDALLLTKDFLSQGKIQRTSGDKFLGDIYTFGKKEYFDSATLEAKSTRESGLILDAYERLVYGRKKKDEGFLFGGKVSTGKLVDFLTGYSSITGLSVNALGALANLLVGKILMLIESGMGLGGEFFNLKDMAKAEGQYFLLIGPVLNEINSNNKASKLGLLLENFDVLQDFYESLKLSGFYRNPVSKIIGNKNLFFMYGLGEHLLRGTTMLAVLNHTKVLNSQGKKVSLLEAFDVDKLGKNGKLKIKEGYTLLNGKLLDKKFLGDIKRRISYVNKSMHGAMGEDEKGMIHRYAFGRLLMNFRQWMPAHYSRRFRGLHYDADLGDFREGFYVSTFKFLRDTIMDLKDHKFLIATRWNELEDMERYNIKRAIVEVALLAILTATISAMGGDDKDKKGNLAYRNLLYLLKRMLMEMVGSSPVPIYGTGYGLFGFVESNLKILNSPFAAINSIDDIFTLIDLTALNEEVKSGKDKGDNLYFHRLERKLPFYGDIKKQLELGEEDYLFNLFP